MRGWRQHGDAGGAAQVKKTLGKLVDDGDVVVKEFGKAQVFWIHQKVFSDVSDARVKELEAEVKQLAGTVKESAAAAKAGAASVAATSSALTTAALEARVAELEKRTAAQERKVASLRADGEQVSRAAFDAQEQALKHALAAFKLRRKLANTMLGEMSEGMGKKPAQILKELDLEPFDTPAVKALVDKHSAPPAFKRAGTAATSAVGKKRRV